MKCLLCFRDLFSQNSEITKTSFENIRERVVKSPKIYFNDVGLAAYLLGIETPDQVSRDPLRGGSSMKTC
ncbi:MAG: DUF4143 domain-containing protein [Deltaproteobacteria bacterium]|nr:DUF4143 domain-containing protein [Deltaproteobacteria bacterium]